MLATIQPVPGDDKKVKITPWRAGIGCLCTAAVIVPKAAVGTVELTGDVSHCCGQTLRVVRIVSADQVSLQEILSGLALTAASTVSKSTQAQAGNQTRRTAALFPRKPLPLEGAEHGLGKISDPIVISGPRVALGER